MAKLRLVVVGNGMAGARAVEEVLLRGGGDQFDIVMFGDEPYGNYNRILLSSILSSAQDPREIFINPLDWYRENNIVLHAGAPVKLPCRRHWRRPAWPRGGPRAYDS
jgi:nitrite reductase (NADH) large subunit